MRRGHLFRQVKSYVEYSTLSAPRSRPTSRKIALRWNGSWLRITPFTSPQDDHIGKAEFLEKCFPTADRVVTQEIVKLVPAGDDGVFIMYEYLLKAGERHRNVEFSTVRSGQVAETQVFFGGTV